MVINIKPLQTFIPSLLVSFGRIQVPYAGSTTLSFHIHDSPKLASLTVILGTRIASPPIFFGFSISPTLHIGSQDCRNATITFGYALRPKIRPIEPKGDIDPTVRWGICNTRPWRGLRTRGNVGIHCRAEQIYCGLWWNRVFEPFLT